MIIAFVLLVLMVTSMAGNLALALKMQRMQLNPTVKVEYREIEVPTKTTNCECGHPSSMHIAENTKNPGDGGCQQEFFELQGKKTTSSFKCFCVRYVEPNAFDDLDRKLMQANRPKEIG